MRHIYKIRPKSLLSPMLLFSLIMFFACLSDSIMSYAAPVYIELHLKNTFLMGLVISFSSVIGLIYDIYIAETFWAKDYKFFIINTLIWSTLFPISFLLFPPVVVTFLIGMGIWGVYYEYKSYSYYNFIHHFLRAEQHTLGWATLTAFTATAYMIGTAVTTNLIDLGPKITFGTSLVTLAVAFLLYKVFLIKFKYRPPSEAKKIKAGVKSNVVEFEILKVLWKKIWPLILFAFTMTLADSCFWTVGTLFTEKLRDTHYIGGMFLTAYMLPATFSGGFAVKLGERLGKKRTSFVATGIAGLLLVCMAYLTNSIAIVSLVFIVSIFLNISTVLMSSVTEDYVARLKEYGNDIVTLEQLSRSISYIIGPAFLGFMATRITFHQTFAFTGGLMALVAILCFLVVPRKIYMPQAELKELTIR